MEEHKQINQQTKLNTNGKSSSFANKNFAHTLKLFYDYLWLLMNTRERIVAGKN